MTAFFFPNKQPLILTANIHTCTLRKTTRQSSRLMKLHGKHAKMEWKYK